MYAWKRNSTGPALGLGPLGAFDDQHIFAPCVIPWQGGYRMWYCGSQGAVQERRFALGLAESSDGKHFERKGKVFSWADDRSVLTASLLRYGNADPYRIDNEFLFYFSACDFIKNDGKHFIHRVYSRDGNKFAEPSPPLIEDAYAPSVLFNNNVFHMWYVDTATNHWFIRYARSVDGVDWEIHPEPVLALGQTWEQQRLNYPYVLCIDDVFVMWYSSRLDKPGQGPASTAIGLARSVDGIHWEKSASLVLLRSK